MPKSKPKIKALKIPPLKLPRSLFGLRTFYAELHKRFKKVSGAKKVSSPTVFRIRNENQGDVQEEMRVLRQLCRMFHRLIHQPLSPEDAVPETVENRLLSTSCFIHGLRDIFQRSPFSFTEMSFYGIEC